MHSNKLLKRKDHTAVTLSLAEGFTKEQSIAVPTVYDRAFEAGLSTGAVGWPGSGGAGTWTWTFAPARDQITLEKYSTTALINELKIMRVPVKMHSVWVSQLWHGSRHRDQLLTDIACYLLERKKPKLLFTYLTAVDLWQHGHGAHCGQAYEMGPHCDRQIQRILASVAESGLADRTTIIVVSDHGFASLSSYVYPNFLLRREGLLAVAGDKSTTAKARALTQGVALWCT